MGLRDFFRSAPPPSMQAKSRSGRAHYRGFLELDELNNELRFPLGLQVFDKMYRSDPDIKRVMSMVCNPIVGGTWSVEPYGGDEAAPKDQKAADFVRWALFERMRPRLSGHLGQLLPVLFRSGFAPFEQVWTDDTWEGRTVLIPKTLALRLPRTILRFNQEQDDLTSLTQMLPTAILPNPQDGTLVDLLIEDLLYYRIGAEGDNWEGTSLLRACFKPWMLKEKLEILDAIAVEREAVGVPVLYPPQGKNDDPILNELEEVLAKLRTSDQGYIVMPGPHAQYAEPGQGWQFEIASHQSSQNRSAKDSLTYHSDKIAAAFVAEFMRLGQKAVGARATADIQQDPFLSSVEALVSLSVEEVLNEQLVPRLVALNFDVDEPPVLSMSLIDSTSLTELKDYIQGLVSAKALYPDGPLEDFLRERADLPPADAAARQKREDAAQQAQDQLNQPPGPTDPNAPPVDPNAPLDPNAPPKQLARAMRPLRPYEQHMSLDQIESSIDEARARFEAAGGDAARAVAKDLAQTAVAGRTPKFSPPQPLVDAIHGELVDLYDTGRRTVADELARQRVGAEPGAVALARDPSKPPKSLTQRAKLAAQAIVTQAWQTISRTALIPSRATAASLQFEGERAALFALRQEAQQHAAPALNEGRTAEANASADEIAGSYYTALLDDPNTCDPCSQADDDVLRPLDDPVRLARVPPNPDCQGGGRCRCLEAYVLKGETPPSA